MIIGNSFNPYTQMAAEKLSSGNSASTKVSDDSGKKEADKAKEKLSRNLTGAEQTKETKGKEQTQKQKEAKDKGQTGTLGSEAFSQHEELTPEQKQEKDSMQQLEQLRQQATKPKGGSLGKSGKASGFNKGFTLPGFSQQNKIHRNKPVDSDSTSKSTTAEVEKEQTDVHTHTGGLQHEMGIDKKNNDKDAGKDKTGTLEFREELRQQRETVTGKGQQERGQGDFSGRGDDSKLGELEAVAKKKLNTTPLQDARSAAEDMKQFQKDTGISTPALNQASEIARTVIDDPAKKGKQTKMTPVSGVNGIIGGTAGNAPVGPIMEKNEPIAVLTSGTASGATEMVTTKLPEANKSTSSDNSILKGDTVKVNNKPIADISSEKTEETASTRPPATIYDRGHFNISQTYVEPKTVTDKEKGSFKEYGVEFQGNTGVFKSNSSSTIIDNLDGKPSSSVPVANLFDGKEHQVLSHSEQGTVMYIAKPDEKDPNHIKLLGSGGPGGEGWEGDLFKTVVDGKETYQTVTYGKNSSVDDFGVKNTMTSTVSGNKEDTSVRVLERVPQEEKPERNTEATGKSYDSTSMTQMGKLEKVPSRAQIRGIVENELNLSDAVCLQSNTQTKIGDNSVMVSKRSFMDGINYEEGKTKNPLELAFDGKEHTVVTNEDIQNPGGNMMSNTILKVKPFKGDPDRIAFTGRHESSMLNGKSLNVEGEAIRTKGEDGKTKIEYTYSLIDPYTNQVVWSGRGDQMPELGQKVMQKERSFEGPLPQEYNLPGSKSGSDKVETGKSSSEGYDVPSFLKDKDGVDKADKTEDVKKPEQDSTTPTTFKEEGTAGFNFGSKQIKQGVMGNVKGFMIDDKFVPGNSIIKSDDGNLIVDNRIVDIDTGKAAAKGQDGIWLGGMFVESGKVGTWNDKGKFIEAGKENN